MPVVVPGITSNQPFDLVIDSIGKLLFWTCSTQDVINVTRLNDSESLGIVHSRNGEKPRLLAIHPTKRFVHLLKFYYTAGQKKTGHLKKSLTLVNDISRTLSNFDKFFCSKK